jgi:hypothetical protein
MDTPTDEATVPMDATTDETSPNAPTDEATVAMDAPADEGTVAPTPPDEEANRAAAPPDSEATRAMQEYEGLSAKYDAILGNVTNRANELKAKGLLKRDAEEASHDIYQHQLVHHIYGSVYDAADEDDKATKLPSIPFKAFALHLAHVENDEKFLLFVDPIVNSAYLPKIGDKCKIRSDDFTFPSKEMAEEQRQG